MEPKLKHFLSYVHFLKWILDNCLMLTQMYVNNLDFYALSFRDLRFKVSIQLANVFLQKHLDKKHIEKHISKKSLGLLY